MRQVRPGCGELPPLGTRLEGMMRSRMWQLVTEGKRRPLMDEEKAELQRLFLRVAENDARLLADHAR